MYLSNEKIAIKHDRSKKCPTQDDMEQYERLRDSIHHSNDTESETESEYPAKPWNLPTLSNSVTHPTAGNMNDTIDNASQAIGIPQLQEELRNNNNF